MLHRFELSVLQVFSAVIYISSAVKYKTLKLPGVNSFHRFKFEDVTRFNISNYICVCVCACVFHICVILTCVSSFNALGLHVLQVSNVHSFHV